MCIRDRVNQKIEELLQGAEGEDLNPNQQKLYDEYKENKHFLQAQLTNTTQDVLGGFEETVYRRLDQVFGLFSCCAHLFPPLQLPASEDSRLNPGCLLYTSPSPRDRTRSRMPSSA
eukprot:TRINITY_DN3772_c0_g1_i2.p1 TRINITY_DN3772_c0_g1~~TRINITY_DN3772_c0_g1_i2.p1  ORF type:complete len:116 (+),score=42.93 TRINITY_DN3772_c0_g1_i2:139-486(+)